jgi:DNA-directed RNA polymerase specialized sigma subunit
MTIADARVQIIAAIKRLPERQQMALHLRYVEEMSEADVAAVMQITEIEVACLQCAAWCAVRQALGREE